jgi:hypothetical protein
MPQLIIETDDEMRENKAAEKRREVRLARRKNEKATEESK